MRILFSGDWHPDVSTLGVSRHEEVAQAVQHTVDVAIDRDVDAYVFLGDLADPDQGGATLRAIELLGRAALAVASKGIDFLAICGNHDVANDGTGATTLTPLRCLEDASDQIRIIERPELVDLDGGLHLLALPYPAHVSVAPKDVEEQATMLLKNVPRAGRYLVAGHLMIPSAGIGEETTEMPRGREVSFPLAATRGAVARFNGHYHRRQTTPEGIIIPGALARLTFGEEDHEPGFLVVDV